MTTAARGTLLAALLLSAGCSSTSRSAPPRAAPGTATTTTSRSIPASTVPRSLHLAVAPWELPAARSREVVLADGHDLLVIGGLEPGVGSTGRVWDVALPAGTTTRLAVLPQVVHDAAGVRLGGDVFVFGGGEAHTIATVQRFDGRATSVVGQLPQPRSDLVAVRIGRTAYVMGGFDGGRELSDVLATSDGVTFRVVAQLAVTVRYPAVAAAGGRIWVFGGEHAGSAVRTVQEIDPATGAVRIAAELPAPLAHATAVVLDGHVLVVGGRSAGRVVATVLEWLPATASTRVAGTLPYGVADAGAAVVDGTGYVVGGETPSTVARAITMRYA